jgi:hypothetical protein
MRAYKVIKAMAEWREGAVDESLNIPPLNSIP